MTETRKTPKTAPCRLDCAAFGKSAFANAQPRSADGALRRRKCRRRRNELSFAEGGAMGVPRPVICVGLAALGMAASGVAQRRARPGSTRHARVGADATEPSNWLPPHRPHLEALRTAREAQRPAELDRVRRQRTTLRAEYISMAPGGEDAAPAPSRHPRVVDRPGRRDPLHDRRSGAVCRQKGFLVRCRIATSKHGDGRRHAVASLEVTSRRHTMYPANEKPAPLAGFTS